jgi:hypothetical protein
MRKITLNPRFGLNTPLAYMDFENTWIIVKEEDKVEEFKARRIQYPYKNYSAQQIEAICEVNHVLEENEQPSMTDEEIEHLLYPFGKEQKVDAEDLQALAGFRVEKTIIQL